MPRPDGPSGRREAPPRVGLDIGGTKVHGVLVDDDDRLLGSVRVPTRPGPAGVVDAAVETVRLLLGGAGAEGSGAAGGARDRSGSLGQLGSLGSLGPLGAVGIGVPGVVDTVAGTVAHAVNLGVVAPFALGDAVSARLDGVPVVVENDLNVAALGAASVLGITGGDLAFLALGTGLAAGLLLDGVLRRGARGAAGEIGHVPYLADGPLCRCGQRGCVELYASGSAIDAAWPPADPADPADRADRADPADPAESSPAPARLFAAARRGDPRAVVVRDRVADAVASAVRVLVLTCDVEHVVLGGGVAELGPALLDAVRDAVRRQADGSPFLTSLQIPDRLSVVPPGAHVAPRGAALAARQAVPVAPEVVSWRS